MASACYRLGIEAKLPSGAMIQYSPGHLARPKKLSPTAILPHTALRLNRPLRSSLLLFLAGDYDSEQPLDVSEASFMCASMDPNSRYYTSC